MGRRCFRSAIVDVDPHEDDDARRALTCSRWRHCSPPSRITSAPSSLLRSFYVVTHGRVLAADTGAGRGVGCDPQNEAPRVAAIGKRCWLSSRVMSNRVAGPQGSRRRDRRDAGLFEVG